LVGPVGHEGCGGALGGLPEPRLGEKLEEGRLDLVRRSCDREADARTEFDDPDKPAGDL
jgi:hypothetical protein